MKLLTERKRGREGKVNRERKIEREKQREGVEGREGGDRGEGGGRERERIYKRVQGKWYSSIVYYYILIERDKDYLEPIQYNLFNIN